MLNLTDKQILEIAEYLEAGMSCYINIRTGVLKTVIDPDKWIGADEEPWEEDWNEMKLMNIRVIILNLRDLHQMSHSR